MKKRFAEEQNKTVAELAHHRGVGSLQIVKREDGC